jgi:hypothetical protein
MYTIIEITTGKVIIASVFDIVEEGQIAITAVLRESMQNPHWDFINEVFYDKPI